ncbi:hypothetical protein ACET3Z_008318 [Daucus carota]
MPYHNSARPVVATLVFLFASWPLGHALLEPGTNLLANITKLQVTGRLFCSPSGNLPAPGSGSLGAGGTLVSGSCNGATGDIGTTALSNTGLLRAVYSLPFSISFASVEGPPCNFIVKLPATGTTCEMFPPRGVLKAGIKLDRLNVDAAGEIMAEAGLLPFRYLPDE